MNFVESLSMFHVDAKEIPCVTEKGAPTEKTLGAPGVLYMDTDTGALYKCRAADYVNELYTWESVEAGGSSDEPITLTDNEALKIGPEGQMLSQEGSTNHIISQSIPVSAGERYRLTCSANFGNSLYAIYSGEADRANLLENLTADATQEGNEIIAQEVMMPTGAKCMIVAWNKLVTDTPYAVVRVSQSAQTTLTLAGQTVVVIGDSVVEDNNKASVNFCDHLAVNTGAEIVNMGVGGTGYMAGQDEEQAFYQRAAEIPDGVDRVLIYGSGNDRDMKLGTPADTGTDTLCGCINATIDAVYERVPTAWVGIIAPAPWRYYPPSDGNNAMALMVQAQRRICARRGIPCLDLYHASGLRPWDDTFRELAFDTEGVHPNDTGHALIAPQIQAFLLGAVGGGAVASVPDSSPNGNDGFSPIATVTQTEDGATISITDKTGTTTATVTNGNDGTTPHIGENGNWWIGETDTGVSAGGIDGSSEWTKAGDVTLTGAAYTITDFTDGVMTVAESGLNANDLIYIRKKDYTNYRHYRLVATDTPNKWKFKNLDGGEETPSIPSIEDYVLEKANDNALRVSDLAGYESLKIKITTPYWGCHGPRASITVNYAAAGLGADVCTYAGDNLVYIIETEKSQIDGKMWSHRDIITPTLGKNTKRSNLVAFEKPDNITVTHFSGILAPGTRLEVWYK